MNEIQNRQYVEANPRARLIMFVFLGLWIVVGLILKEIVDSKVAQINSLAEIDPHAAARNMNDVFIWTFIVPMSFFLSIQGIYLLRLSTKIFLTGIHPPPGAKMPFKTIIYTGKSAKLMSAGYFIASLFSFAIIVLLFMRRYIVYG